MLLTSRRSSLAGRLLRQLVQQAGVAPADITLYDAIRHVPATIFDRGTKNFPASTSWT